MTLQEKTSLPKNVTENINTMYMQQHTIKPMLSTVITTDGFRRNVVPSNGTDFSLEELRGFVGGYIEIVCLSQSWIMVVNEEGKLRKV